MLDKLMGKAAVVNKSSYGIERFLDEGEEVIRVLNL